MTIGKLPGPEDTEGNRLLSLPHHTDLHLYLQGVHIIEVAIDNDERAVWLHAVGGWGYLRDASGEVVMMPYGSDVAAREHFVLSTDVPNAPAEIFEHYSRLLMRWVYESVLVDVYASDLRAVVLVEDIEHWVPLPAVPIREGKIDG